MKRTWLVQRLEAPRPKTGNPLDKAHRVFGGAMLGLTEQAWDVLDQVCTVDYMGSAEYEWGNLPTSLHALAEDSEKLVGFEFAIKANKIGKPYWREQPAEHRKRWYKKNRRREIDRAKASGRKPEPIVKDFDPNRSADI